MQWLQMQPHSIATTACHITHQLMARNPDQRPHNPYIQPEQLVWRPYIPKQFCSNDICDVKVLNVLVVVPQNGSDGVDVIGGRGRKTDAWRLRRNWVKSVVGFRTQRWRDTGLLKGHPGTVAKPVYQCPDSARHHNKYTLLWCTDNKAILIDSLSPTCVYMCSVNTQHFHFCAVNVKQSVAGVKNTKPIIWTVQESS